MRKTLGRQAILLSMAAVFWSQPVQAQYFGQNKVQYQRFQFRVLKTTHFDIYYYPEEAAAANEAARMAERWHARLSRVLIHELRGRQPVILYDSHPAFAQTNVIEGEIGEGTGGVTESARRRVTLPFGASLEETDHVLGHELVHAFQYDMLGAGAEAVPLWFIEGMAEYLSLGSRDVQTAMWLRDAAIRSRLPTIDKLDDPRYFPYRFGHAFWAYVGGRFGDETIGRILHRISQLAGQGMAGGTDAISAVEAITRRDRQSLSNEWHAAIRETYDLRPPPEDGTVVGERAKAGSLNVGPALSPDGSRLAFLSTRDRLSIDLFLADATTGRVVRKLISTAADPHFESLQFLASAGSWDPDGQRLAIATLRAGRPVLAIVDATGGDIEKEVRFDNLGEIFQPAWSPTGEAIAFAAQAGGHTDLFVHDLSTGQTRRLTDDSYADLQPAWSPDGRRLLFVTDRFSAALPTLAFSDYRLGLMNVDTGAMSEVDAGLAGNVVNGQWGQDARTVFLIADAGGRQNAYRLDLSSRRAVRITDEVTGVAGITPMSPALSVARTGDKVALSIFHDSGYEIRVRDLAAARAPAEEESVRDQAVLPPGGRTPGVVTEFLRDPSVGLPAASVSFPTQPYSSRFALIDVGQSIGASTSQFGTYANGGIQFVFSDILGNHLLGTALAVNGTVADIAASINYLNRTSRWNWGVYGQRLPLLTGAVSTGIGIQNGRQVFVQETELMRQTFTEGGFITAYPFSRATRVEFTASASHIGFTHELRTQIADPDTGALLSDQTVRLPSFDSIRLTQVAGAVVRDTALFGATSPILGQRLRFELAPNFGDLKMVNVTVDFRRYLMPVRPITLTGRVLHIGRYGGSGEDQRLLPLFLGYPSLVRGYEVGSFQPSDCTPTPSSSCPEFDRLVGSRILVANGEVRTPLMGLFTGRLEYGALPVELLAFADSGVAWTRAERPTFAGGSREWVSSVGVGARVNLLGYLITEFNLARPVNRPQAGWIFVFNLQPGF